MNPYRTPAPSPMVPAYQTREIDWDDATLVLLEQSWRVQEEAGDYYRFRDALPSWWRLVLGWLTLA